MFNIVEGLSYPTVSIRKVSAPLWWNFPKMIGANVFIKPNLVSPRSSWDKSSTTNVRVMEMIVEWVIQAGASHIIIGDCGFKDQWAATIKSTGYDELPKKYPVKLVPLQDGENFHKFTLKRLDKYRSLFGAKFSDYMLAADVVINVPKMKVHCMAGVTGAIKNMMGTMTQKGNMHPRASVKILHERLADLYALTTPMVKFTIMDGVMGSEYAEQCGHSIHSGVLLSGTDQWEIDVAAAKLMGFDPNDVPYLRYIRNDFDTVVVPAHLIKQYERPLSWKNK